MKKSMSFFVSVCAGTMVLLLAGCSSKELTEKRSTAVKRLTVCTAKELDNLSTLTMNKENNLACGFVYEPLVVYRNGAVQPKLAERWEWKDNNTTLVFYLRKGVKFSDGVDFNAENAKRILDFAHSNPNFSGIKGIANITGIDVTDSHTIAIHYAAPSYSYLNDFCFQNVASMMSVNVFTEGNFQTFSDVIGTGPYIRTAVVAGDYTEFKRNEQYWGEKAYYDEIIVKYIPEASSRLQALQKGEIDMIYGSDLISYDNYKKALTLPGIGGKIHKESTLTKNLVLNAASESLKDVRVRRAIHYAINKEEIAQGLTYGYEQKADSLFNRKAPFSDITYTINYSFDLAKACALLDEAGWKLNTKTGIREKDNTALSLRYTYWTNLALAKETALTVKTQLAEAGIHVETVGQDQMTWWTEGVRGNYDITTWNTEGSYTEPHKFLQESLGVDPHNVSLHALTDFTVYEKAVSDLSSSTDESVIKEAVKIALQFINDNAIDCPLSYAKEAVLYRTDNIADYEFTDTPQFFDASKVIPVK